MDASLLASAGVGSSTIAILFLLYKAFNRLQGHKLVSNCCGRKAEVGFAVADMSPSRSEEKKNPPAEADAVGDSKGNLTVKIPALPESP
jgi:hypothetical protein